MNQIHSHIITALNNIDKRYYEMQNVAFHDGNLQIDPDASPKNYERRFMTEFSSQYSRILDKNTNNLYKGTIYDSEIPKEYIYTEGFDAKIKDTYEKLSKKANKQNSSIMNNSFTTIPDFLIHKSQTDRDTEFQKLIIEAKTNPDASEIERHKDIFHINIYAEKYNYQNCIILLINYQKDKWLKALRSYLGSVFYLASPSKQNNISIIFKENYEAMPIIHSFVELKTICQNNIKLTTIPPANRTLSK